MSVFFVAEAFVSTLQGLYGFCTIDVLRAILFFVAKADFLLAGRFVWPLPTVFSRCLRKAKARGYFFEANQSLRKPPVSA